MRLYLWGRHRLIELRSRDDGSLARYRASNGDLRVMRLWPFPKSAGVTIHRHTHDRRPFLKLRMAYMGMIFQIVLNNFSIVGKNFFASFSSSRINAKAAWW
jgi:hypothetical protein